MMRGEVFGWEEAVHACNRVAAMDSLAQKEERTTPMALPNLPLELTWVAEMWGSTRAIDAITPVIDASFLHGDCTKKLVGGPSRHGGRTCRSVSVGTSSTPRLGHAQ